jgi:glycosyltransferase involved in cell wall biosynthesis
MNLQDSITVVITAYNSQRHLAEAIESVLRQSLAPAQIVVVDDGSTDGTAEIALSFPAVELIRQENSGPGAARNAGVRAARHPWLALLDSDDLWHPDKLQKQIEWVREKEIELVFTSMRNARLEADGRYKPESLIIPGLLPTTFLGSRDLFTRFGPFAEDRTFGEFIEWMARVDEAGLRYDVLPEVLATRRIHTTNLGVVGRSRHLDYVSIVRQIQLRRRAAAGSAEKNGAS